ncbi:cell division/cell wall cluster transcriptional repressor MraZ [bacterium]|nr:cell division/cell wall cluster transcriptional repressor MraZ [bacterium]|tara:strand:+ start:18722 stop:19156 length:435 start_codon:yes stop_codon:yes gene_type:complete
MLIGEYKHTLDKKKRVAVPARFRKELGKKIILTRGFDKCLFIYPLKEWSKLSEKLETLPIGKSDTRNLNRFMFSGAVPTDIDSLGRIVIPDFLKDFAGLKTKVVMVGVHGRAEVWDEKTWNAYKGGISKKADDVAEKLGDLGVF